MSKEKQYKNYLYKILTTLKENAVVPSEDAEQVNKMAIKVGSHDYANIEAIRLVVISIISANSGDVEKVKECLERIVELYPLITNPMDKIEVCRYLGMEYRDRGEHQRALEYLYEGRNLARNSGSISILGKVIGYIAGVLNQTGNYVDAIRYGFELLNLKSTEQNVDLEWQGYGIIGSAYCFLGNYDLAIEYEKNQTLLCKKYSKTLHLAFGYNNIGTSYMYKGDFKNAETYFKKALKILTIEGQEIHLDRALCSVGIVYLHKQQYSQAMKVLNRGYSIAKRYGKKQVMVMALINIGEGLRQQGKYDEAVERLQEGIKLMENENYPHEEIMLHNVLSVVYSNKELFKEAYEQRKIVEKLELRVRNDSILRAATTKEVSETLYRLEKEQKELEERARKAEEEAKHKEEQLQEVTSSLQQSMKTLKEVEEVVKPFLEQDDEKTKALANSIYKSLSKTIKAQRSQKPEKYFDKGYQEYIGRLHKACEALTPMEIKVCILIKLNYSNKQIGEVMNVSELTVKTHRARIRKKMSLIPQENLLSVLLRI